MTDRPAEMQDDRNVELLNPMMAAFLAWLIPGLGHLYQRRAAKAILFFVCIVGTFAYGVYLGGNETYGYGRAVYASWERGERRLPYLAQVWVGLPAMPALIEANRARAGRQPLFGGFMCPPAPGNAPGDPGPAPRYSLGTLKGKLPGFELGTTFTMIAGLLNVLAIYDAWDGPVSYEANRKEDEDEDEDEDEEEEDDEWEDDD